MNDKIMEQRILEHNARNAEMVPVHIKEKRAYSVGDIMAMLDISRSSALSNVKPNIPLFIPIRTAMVPSAKNGKPAAPMRKPRSEKRKLSIS